MKHRILFVDDEELVLQGLQRMLRPLRHEWEMDFFDSGAKALQAMAKLPYDILVTDMRMPVMDGAQLLKKTMQLHPATIRVVLSGQADQKMILQCVEATHQYLSKPCDQEALIATLRRAAQLKESLHNETLRNLIARLQSLPSKPKLYLEIIHCLQQPNATVEDVAGIVMRDPAMTAKILKLVNSAFFGLPLKIASINEAISYLGLDTLRSLVLSISVFEQFEGIDSRVLSVEALWTHSFEVANAAQIIAGLENSDKKTKDEAFIGGLLHDAGKLVLAANFSEEYERCVKAAAVAGSNQADLEERTFGSAHSEIGGYLFGLWGLPIGVVEAVALHHSPSQSQVLGFTPLTAVHSADVLVHQKHRDGHVVDFNLDKPYLEKLRLTERVAKWKEAISI